MKHVRTSLFAGLMIAVLATSPARPCSLCQGLGLKEQHTLREELTQAKIIVFGYLANPRFIDERLGTGATDLHIEKVLKDNGGLGNRKTLQLDRYMPVLDPKNPPRFVIFCDAGQGKLDPYYGVSVQSPAVLDYLKGLEVIQDKDRSQQLLFYFRQLDHEDKTIAQDAFLEFARCSDREVGDIARQLDPERLRRLLSDPNTLGDKLSLFAFLLGGCGGDRDALLLRKLIDGSGIDRNLDGLLSGYVHLRPQEGWDMVYGILSDRDRPVLQQYAAVRTLRFYHGWKADETRQQVLRCYTTVVQDGEIADMAIEDLRRWQMWDLTALVLAQHASATHKSPIVRRAIVRYALCCPLPEAREFLERLERQPEYRDLLRDLREGLALER